MMRTYTKKLFMLPLLIGLWSCQLPPEDCTDDVDNNGNGLIDCEDDECSNVEACLVCGDGEIDTAEQCDGANLNGATCESQGFDGGALSCTDGCALDLSLCKNFICGDGVLDLGEACDDGNQSNGDACDQFCRVPFCGNGQADPGEGCDDQNLDNEDDCTNLCQDATCGDGFLFISDEECDDGNILDGDGCEADCTLGVCGNGIRGNGEGCDDGNTLNGDGCNEDCFSEFCGDGVFDIDIESCDDGDLQVGDGCDGLCEIEGGFTCTGEPSQCFPCGDLGVDPGQQCDDGNNVSGDGCDAQCQLELCGDGIINNELFDPTSIELIWLADSCDGPADITFALNGQNIFTGEGASGVCDCLPGIRQVTITDPAALNLLADDNTISVQFPEDLAWAVAVISTQSDSQEVILFDATGKGQGIDDAINRNENICDAFAEFNVFVSAGFDVTALTTAEECDDGNTASEDGCSSACILEFCGDGVIQGNLNELCDDLGRNSLFINSLTADNCQIVDHDNLTGDDRGGIGLSTDRVFYSGDNAMGAFELATLAGVVAPSQQDAMVSDLSSGKLYALASAGIPLQSNGGLLDSLVELDSITGAPTTTIIPLSSPALLPDFDVGVFAGPGFALIHNRVELFEINFTSGRVTNHGPMAEPLHQGCENWAYWGVAEFFGGELFVAAVSGSEVIRHRVPDGQQTTIASFSDLSDMCSFLASPSSNKWFFHHENSSQFGGDSETLGSCDAALSIEDDGCGTTCQLDAGFACNGEPSLCDAICGDGLIAGDEECDDSNTTPGDGCSDLCELEP